MSQRTIVIFVMIITVLSAQQSAIIAQTNDHLLITEFVVTPTEEEFIEIYNPTSSTIDLSNYYLTDATNVNGGNYYYNIVTGDNYGGGSGYDFHARFPEVASIVPGEYQTIALNGDSAFFAIYGTYPTYEIAEDGASGTDVPDMREAVPGSVQGLTSGLTNGDEVIILYYWDGISDLVLDVDYVVYDNAGEVPDEAVDKTGIKIDGPDADTDSSTYLNDTPIPNQDLVSSPANGSSAQRMDFTEGNEIKIAGNGITGDDETSENLSLTWVIAGPTPNNAFPIVKVSIPDTTVNSASSISIPVNIEDVTGLEIKSYAFDLIFNQDVLDATGVTVDGTLPLEWESPTVVDSLGKISIAAADTIPLIGAGVLIYVNFQIVGELGAHTPIELANFIFNEGEPWVSLSNGSVTTTEKIDTVKVSIPDTTANSVSSISIPVNIEDVANLGINFYAFDLTFNQDVLDATGITVVGTLPQEWESPAVVDSLGKISIAGADTISLTGAGVLIYVDFQIVGTAGTQSTLELENFIFNEGNPWVNLSNGSITITEKIDTVNVFIPDTTGKSGESITIPIYVDDVTGLDITSYHAALSYDQQVLEATGPIMSGTLSEQWGTVVFSDSAGHIAISGSGSSSLTGSGVLIFLTFEIIGNDGSQTELFFNDMVFNEGNPIANTMGGTLVVSGVSLVKDNLNSTVSKYSLSRNYPNPFNPSTIINYTMAKNANVCIKVYSITGELVATLVNTLKPQGNHFVEWNGKTIAGDNVTSGMYFVKMVSSDFNKVNKMMLVR